MSKTEQAEERRLIATMRLVWGAILFSTVMFLFVLLGVERPPPETPMSPLIAAAFAVTSLTLAIASFALPAWLLRLQLSKLSLGVREDDAPPGLRPGAAQPMVTDPSAARIAALRAYQAPLILSLGLSEPVALFGFVLGFVHFPPTIYLPFFVAGWLLIIVRFPRTQSAVRALAKVKGVRVHQR